VLIAFLNREERRYEESRGLLQDAEEGLIQLWAPTVILDAPVVFTWDDRILETEYRDVKGR
jgi:hypothetical protein